MEPIKRKLLENTLRYAFTDMIFMMKIEVDDRFTYDFFNQAVREKLHFTDEQIGQSFSDVFASEQADFLQEKHRQAAQTASVLKISDGYMSTLEKTSYMNSTLTPLFDQNGVCTHVVSVVSDSTNPIHWQNRLKEREKEFRRIGKDSTDLMAIIDSDERVRYASPSHEILLGYDIDRLKGRHQEEFIHPEDYPLLLKKLEETIKLGKPLNTNIRLVKKNQEVLLCRMTGTADYHNDGSFKYLVVVSQDITHKKEQEEEMKRLAYYDFLTQIPNRRKFNLEFNKALTAWKDTGNEFALFLLDIDQFKQINDQWGHDIGDTILVELGKRLNEVIAERDTIARIGGDEFALIIRDVTSFEHIQSIAQFIKILFNRDWGILPQDLQVYTSIGVSWSGSYKKDTIDFLHKNADIALYEAKKNNGNQVVFH